MSPLELSMTGVVLLACLYVSYTDARFRRKTNAHGKEHTDETMA
jgi:hypothetical protein